MRLAGTDGEHPAGRGGGRGGHQPGGDHRADPGRAARRPRGGHRRAGRRRAVVRRAGGLRVLLDDHPRVRRDRAAGRDLRDLQHVLDHRAAAHPRARPAARRRRQPATGAVRGDHRGRRRRPDRRAPRPRASASSWPRASSRRSATTSRPASPSPSPPRSRRCSIGVVVTLVAAIIPAVRATRVPPLAAMRDVAIERSGASKIRIGIGLAARAARRLPARAGVDRRRHLGRAAPGVPGRRAARRRGHHGRTGARPARASAWRAAAWPAASGITGKLAVENAARSPKRTSATASALLIGVSLVALLLVFADVGQGVDRQGDLPRVRRRLRRDERGRRRSAASAASRRRSPTRWPRSTGVDRVLAQTFAPAEITYDDGETVQQFLTSRRRRQPRRRPRGPHGGGRRWSDLDDDGIIVDVELADAHDVRDRRHRSTCCSSAARSSTSPCRASPTTSRCSATSPSPATPTWRACRSRSTPSCSASIDEGADLDDGDGRHRRRSSRRCPTSTVEDREGFIGSIADQIAFIRQLHQHHAAALDRHRPDRRGQHAVALDQRAGPRARPAPGRRHEPDAAQAVDPVGGGDHVGARHRRSASSWPS